MVREFLGRSLAVNGRQCGGGPNLWAYGATLRPAALWQPKPDPLCRCVSVQVGQCIRPFTMSAGGVDGLVAAPKPSAPAAALGGMDQTRPPPEPTLTRA